MPYEQNSEKTTARLARGTPPTRLGTPAKRLATKRHCRSAGVSAGAVSQWLKRARAEGIEALRQRKGGGPKRRLSEEQLAALPALLAQGAEHFGFRGDVWTQPRVAALIKREFGVSYHPRHVGRLLKQVKWSRQKPLERAAQRQEAAIEQWRADSWEDLKKKPTRKDVPSCS